MEAKAREKGRLGSLFTNRFFAGAVPDSQLSTLPTPLPAAPKGEAHSWVFDKRLSASPAGRKRSPDTMKLPAHSIGDALMALDGLRVMSGALRLPQISPSRLVAMLPSRPIPAAVVICRTSAANKTAAASNVAPPTPPSRVSARAASKRAEAEAEAGRTDTDEGGTFSVEDDTPLCELQAKLLRAILADESVQVWWKDQHTSSRTSAAPDASRALDKWCAQGMPEKTLFPHGRPL